MVFPQPIVLDFKHTVGTVCSVIRGIMFNFLLFQTLLFTGAPAKLFTSGMYCEIYFPEFPLGEINWFVWEAWEKTMMHSFYKRSLEVSLFFICSRIFSFLPKVRKLFDIYFSFPHMYVLWEETESLKLFPNMLPFNLVTVKLVVQTSDYGFICSITNTDRPSFCWAGTKALWGASEGRAVCFTELPDPCLLTSAAWHLWNKPGRAGLQTCLLHFLKMLLLSVCIDVFPDVQILKPSYFLHFKKWAGAH